MTLLSAAEMHEWVGRPAMDPYGEPLGAVAAILRDAHSGAPEWLLLADPSAEEGRLVPVAGAVPSGRHVRVVPIAERVRGAPAARRGEDVDPQTKARAAAHYGLTLDHESSPTGIVSDRPARSGEHGRRHVRAPAQPSREVIQGLRAAHAMEEGSLKLLSALRRRVRDEELVHDIALHQKATEGHAEAVQDRLEELGAGDARGLDLLAGLGAFIEVQRGRLRRVPEEADLEEAYRSERAEAKAYDGLRALAERAGDEPTAKLCEQHLADEVAMAMTLRKFRPRL